MPVRKRGSVYWLDFRYQGKRYRRPAGGDFKEASKALDKIRGRIASGDFDPAELDPQPSEKPAGVAFESALDLYVASRLDKGKSAHSYKRLVGDWLQAFEGRTVCSITGEEIERTLAGWTETRRLSPATRNNALAQLSGFLTWCMRRRDNNGRRWIEHHPIRDGGVERFAVDNARERWLRPDEIERLRAAAPEWLAEIIVFACSSGMRLSEVCGLIKASHHKDAEGRPFLMTERTKNGERLVWPLEGEVKAIVERRLEACRFSGDRLFPGPSGRGALVGIRRELPGVIRATGLEYGRYRTVAVKDAEGKVVRWSTVRDTKGRPIPNPMGVTFHVFRHSMASLAINGGVPASVVQRMGNWKTRSMLDRYAHLADETLREAAGTVARLVARGHTMVTTAKEPEGESVLSGAGGGS